MSVFGPNQVGELIIGDAIATETTVATFLSSASEGEIKLLSKDGTAPTAGKPFYVLQKASAAQGGFEFSDVIDPRYIDKIALAEYSPEVAKIVKVDGFAGSGVLAVNRTYEVSIRLENELSPENFEYIHGYYNTGSALGSLSASDLRDGIIDSLQKALDHRGGGEFVVASDGTGLTITEVIQTNVPGKKDGRKLTFTVTAKVFNNISNGVNENLDLLTVTQTQAPDFGNGTGKWATNLEWFIKGYKYEVYRQTGYPADFNTPYYASQTGTYNVLTIRYYQPRVETSVERQYKVLYILFARTDAASNAVVNTFLDDLDTAAGSYITVPSDLPTE